MVNLGPTNALPDAIYVSIGNSDDKLSQKRWFEFVRNVDSVVRLRSLEVHGAWFSNPVSPYQNACWCFEIWPSEARILKTELAMLAHDFGQDSITWAPAKVEFIAPAVPKLEEA